MAPETTIYYPSRLREAFWPSPLATAWASQYPEIFDANDLRETETQPKKHFHEWFLAVHIFQRFGQASIVEKAQYFDRHPAKLAKINRLMSDDRFNQILDACESCGVQWPDLLVYSPDFSRYWFAEAKGLTDRISIGQRTSHKLLRQLRIPVRLFNVLPR